MNYQCSECSMQFQHKDNQCAADAATRHANETGHMHFQAVREVKHR